MLTFSRLVAKHLGSNLGARFDENDNLEEVKAFILFLDPRNKTFI